MNKVILTGRLTKDPELRYTPSGTPVCRFNLAVSRMSADGEADFVPCTGARAGIGAEMCVQR